MLHEHVKILHRPILLVLFGLCLLVSTQYSAYAGDLPWENENSVATAMLVQDGRQILLEGVVVGRMAARQDPAYFVVHDSYRPNSRIAVLCRPPAELSIGQTVDVTGTAWTLPNGERLVIDPTVYGYFDSEGRLVKRAWASPFRPWPYKEILPSPTGSVPPSDPSLADNGTGVPGEVDAELDTTPVHFQSVAALIAAAPPVLTPISLSCKPIVEVGNGFVIVGDDGADSRVKVYSPNVVGPKERLLRLSGTLHTEDGKPAIYAGTGPAPYFDPQGFTGQMTTAKIGTVAYAATLADAVTEGSSTGGRQLMSVSTPTTSDGNWVYLTGQVVTGMEYLSYFNMYVQRLDRTPGIRVVEWAASADWCNIVDVMGKLATMDGQRVLDGVTDPDAVEVVVLHNNYGRLLPNPLGMSNRALGGCQLGNNPGVTSEPFGLYNVGSLVRVWGKVVEETWDDNNQLVWIDDGSNVPFAGFGQQDRGVLLFAPSGLPNPYVYIGDDISVTGVSSIWKPYGSSETYRAVCAISSNTQSPVAASQPNSYGTLSGTVAVYDIPAGSGSRYRSGCTRPATGRRNLR
jgi:hypothetical protein